MGGESIVPTASKPSQLLAMFALNAGRVVSTTALTEEIWEYKPPRSGVPTLHTYILKLRRKLQHALAGEGSIDSKDILITRRSGYLLNVAPESVDAFRYEQLSATGRDAVNAGDHETASRALGEALRLWRGPALADVPTGPQLAIEAMRLEETRLGDLHLRIEADLRLGRHHQLLGELAMLCARHPLLENFCTQHMVALYRSGRQSQALEAYRRLRTAMVEQLGVEPSARVRQVHHAVLTGHAVMDDSNFVFTS
ncbi:AfsR/SARP family transcriptional regulator [Actinophytocola gossypii]|uniref:AfsR/SARP family transcriptional regulator n=1 Tax=Actinophytocola gossypii TaxID=2812003 RepID=UPI0021A8E84B|nr:AfsR/SARP family transcriptional regulator [Actinophytocola gossypii]